MTTEGIREDWFPTSIWYYDHDDLQEPYHDRWVAELYRMKEEDRLGVTDRSSRLGWHSHTNVHENEVFAPLMERILEAAEEVAEFGQWALKDYEPFVINAWGNINPKYGHNQLHSHPHSLLSGVYYLQTPPDCGDIEFRDPREVRMMEVIPLSANNRWTFKTVHYPASPGRMLFFPSWLLHEVKPNLSDQDRICVSFNVGCRPRKS